MGILKSSWERDEEESNLIFFFFFSASFEIKILHEPNLSVVNLWSDHHTKSV